MNPKLLQQLQRAASDAERLSTNLQRLVIKLQANIEAAYEDDLGDCYEVAHQLEADLEWLNR